MMEQRQCLRCQAWKPIEEYRWSPTTPNVRLQTCIACWRLPLKEREPQVVIDWGAIPLTPVVDEAAYKAHIKRLLRHPRQPQIEESL